MPEICRFLGIIITMYFKDHDPPHSHMRYGEHRASVAIASLELRTRKLPPRVLGLLTEWAELHRPKLMENWTTLATGGKFKRIAPLV